MSGEMSQREVGVGTLQFGPWTQHRPMLFVKAGPTGRSVRPYQRHKAIWTSYVPVEVKLFLPRAAFSILKVWTITLSYLLNHRIACAEKFFCRKFKIWFERRVKRHGGHAMWTQGIMNSKEKNDFLSWYSFYLLPASLSVCHHSWCFLLFHLLAYLNWSIFVLCLLA